MLDIHKHTYITSIFHFVYTVKGQKIIIHICWAPHFDLFIFLLYKRFGHCWYFHKSLSQEPRSPFVLESPLKTFCSCWHLTFITYLHKNPERVLTSGPHDPAELWINILKLQIYNLCWWIWITVSLPTLWENFITKPCLFFPLRTLWCCCQHLWFYFCVSKLMIWLQTETLWSSFPQEPFWTYVTLRVG